MTVCQKCGRPLSDWDEGFYKKLVNRGAEPLWCAPCTASYFGMDRETALRMLRRFRQAGCTLFPDADPPEDLFPE